MEGFLRGKKRGVVGGGGRVVLGGAGCTPPVLVGLHLGGPPTAGPWLKFVGITVVEEPISPSVGVFPFWPVCSRDLRSGFWVSLPARASGEGLISFLFSVPSLESEVPPSNILLFLLVVRWSRGSPWVSRILSWMRFSSIYSSSPLELLFLQPRRPPFMSTCRRSAPVPDCSPEGLCWSMSAPCYKLFSFVNLFFPPT